MAAVPMTERFSSGPLKQRLHFADEIVTEATMIPPVTHPIWAQLITGTRELPASKVGLNMLIANIRLSYTKDPSEVNLERLVARMHEFFTRYGAHYQTELEQILRSGAHA
jgi:hypothetical protein